MKTIAMLLASLCLSLALMGCGGQPPSATSPDPLPNEPLGLLEVTLSGLDGESPQAQSRWVGGEVGAQAITLNRALPTLTPRISNIADADNTRYVSAVFDLTNSSSTSYNNLTLYALNDPARSVGGTAFTQITAANGNALSDPAVARAFQPIPGMRYERTGMTVAPNNAHLQLLTPAEVTSVKGQLSSVGLTSTVEPLQFGFVAQGLGGSRAIGAVNCTGANCNRGYVTVAFRFARSGPSPSNPDRATLVFAVGNETSAIGSQSLEEQPGNLVNGQPASSVTSFAEVRTLFGNSYSGNNENDLCQVVIAGSLQNPLVRMPTLAAGQSCTTTPPPPPASNRWVSSGPGGGGAFNSPVISPDGRIWAVGSDLGGVYISFDQGQTWRPVGSADGLTNTHVASLAFQGNSRLIIGTELGIYSASISGSSISVSRRWIGTSTMSYVAALVVASDTNVLYAAVHPNFNALEPFVLRSSDGGLTWARTTGTGLPSSLRVVGLRVHPVDSNAVVLVSGAGRFNQSAGQVWLSNNAGASWTRLAANLGEIYDFQYSLNPTNLNEAYLTTATGSSSALSGGLYRSTDAGWNWTLVNGSRTGAILMDATNPARIRLAEMRDAVFSERSTKHGIWESTNSGASFTQVSTYRNWNAGWSQAPQSWGGVPSSFQGYLQTFSTTRSNQTILWTDTQFVFASTDGGRTFNQVVSNQVAAGRWRSRGVDNAVPTVVSPSPANANLVYVGYRDMGLWRTDDGGQSWTFLWSPGITTDWCGGACGGNTFTVLPDPSRAEVVWAQLGGDPGSAGNQRVLRSTNRGQTWVAVSGLPNAVTFSGLSLDASSSSTNRTLYVVADGQVYRSSDDGQSWNLSFGGCTGCFFTYVLNGTVFAGGGGGLWRLPSGSSTWEATAMPTSSWSGSSVVWWENGYVGLSDLALLPNGQIWAAVMGRGFYRSADGGRNWTLALSDPLARTVTATGNQILIGSSSAFNSGGFSAQSAGVRISSDGGSTWQAFNTGLAYPFATQIRVGADGAWWLLSPGQGVLKRQ